ncbi:PAS domain-containing sensor histidine kinase [Rhizobium sp. RM]|uniref:hybrid sensor histidine kinase/response regulator n=1 Tax=Rhizobium sp. RM TaxID=2748079 RepID=UPI00110E498A|nr:PAS domain-containing sensor histidine kinase [Rhizobium sp. RM]NWJ24653.1 response regulator [Rhizobium sp. RM]TMV16458.1 response regulator [Rhizobium sp. Td3]
MSELAKRREKIADDFDAAVASKKQSPVAEDVSPHLGRQKHSSQLARLSDFPTSVVFLAAVALALLFALALPFAATVLIALLAAVAAVAFFVNHRFFASKALDAISIHEEEGISARRMENRSIVADIHEVMGDIVVIRDMDRRIVEANAIFRDMTGCVAPEGRTCEEIGIAFRPGDRAHAYDVEIATPFGQRIFVWQDAVTRDIGSSRLLISSIARDVTEERFAVATREDARARAEKADADKARLLATVSHEIRLPLSGILGMNHLLSQTRLNQEQRNYLDGMRQSGQSLVQLVEDLLDYSTMEAGRFTLNPRAENLRQLIESVVEMLAHRAHEKGIEIASSISVDVPDYLDFDPARLRQILFNLIGNAVKFTKEGGVVVRADFADGDLRIAVEDSGPGMTRAEQARIFREFEQAGPLTQRSAGTGLGLAISARIMREFGGKLAVSSRKGKGSVFTLSFRPGSVGTGKRTTDRRRCLDHTNVLLLAPSGVASGTMASAISAFGGRCTHIHGLDDLTALLDSPANSLVDITDVIVDQRIADDFKEVLRNAAVLNEKTVRRTLLVSPEERPSQMHGDFDAWLIRPLREKSLIDVLCGRLRGIERRDAINDNHPDLGLSPRMTSGSFGIDVLVAEDDAVNARIIEAVLRKSGFSPRLVSDFDALRLAIAPGAETLPDVVISDLNMPGGDGLEVLPALFQSRKGERQIPVIVLTGETDRSTADRLLEAGAGAVLTKPVDPKRLIEEIRRLLEGKRLFLS